MLHNIFSRYEKGIEVKEKGILINLFLSCKITSFFFNEENVNCNCKHL